MLKQNIEPRIEHIKEISFAMKTFPAILDKGDYIALRGGIYMILLCVYDYVHKYIHLNRRDFQFIKNFILCKRIRICIYMYAI